MTTELKENETSEKNQENNSFTGEKMVLRPERASEKCEKCESAFLNIIFSICLVVIVGFSCYLVTVVSQHSAEMRALRPDYSWPSISSFLWCIVFVPIFLSTRMACMKFFSKPIEAIMKPEHINPTSNEEREVGIQTKKKLLSNLYKACYYIFITISAFFILKDLEFFPSELLGNGSVDNLWKFPYPEHLFFSKPRLFEIYYMLNLSYTITDFLFLAFINEIQSDFIVMLLHHFCTISLVVFSFLVNYSNIGCIVFFLHDSSDIFIYIARSIILTKAHDLWGVLLVLIMMASMIYNRLFVFGKLISSCFCTNFVIHVKELAMIVAMCFLYFLHVNWIYKVIKKLVLYAVEGKVEDLYKIKKK